MPTPPPRYRVGFVIEQALGHITHGQNLRRFVEQDISVEPIWGLPSWQRSGLAARAPLYRSNWTLQAGLQARRLLRRMQQPTRPQALFFHTQVTATLAPDWLRRIPSVVSLDATPRQYDRLGSAYQHATGPAWLEHAKWRLNRLCFGLARHIVTWSAWAKSGLINEYGIPPEKISVVPPGVDPQAFAPVDRRRGVSGAPRILFVGGDFERKGGPILLEAFRRLRHMEGATQPAAGPGAGMELHVVTRDNLAPEPGVTVHRGLSPNEATLRRLFGECDIFCLPTQADCLPIALMEAGAAGLPLVAADLAAIPEIVVEGQSGLLVPPGDPEALAGALARLVVDRPLRLALGAGALEMVQRQFDAELNSRLVLQLIKQVIDQALP